MSLLENLSPLVFPSKPVRSDHMLSWLYLTYTHPHTEFLTSLQFFQSSKASRSQEIFRTFSSPFESNFTQPICLENANKFFGDQLKVQINSEFCNSKHKFKKRKINPPRLKRRVSSPHPLFLKAFSSENLSFLPLPITIYFLKLYKPFARCAFWKPLAPGPERLLF